MREEAISRLRTLEAIQALLEGRDRGHALLCIRKSDLAQSRWDREKQAVCKCGWYAYVSARRVSPKAVWEDHVRSEASRPPRTDAADPALVRDVIANADFLLAGAYSSMAAAEQAAYLHNRLQRDRAESLEQRPPSIPPMPFEQFGSLSVLEDDDADEEEDGD